MLLSKYWTVPLSVFCCIMDCAGQWLDDGGSETAALDQSEVKLLVRFLQTASSVIVVVTHFIESAVLFPWCTAVRRPVQLRLMWMNNKVTRRTRHVAILFSGGMFQVGKRNNVHTRLHKDSLQRLKTQLCSQLYKNTQRLRRLYLHYEQGDKQWVTDNKGNEK